MHHTNVSSCKFARRRGAAAFQRFPREGVVGYRDFFVGRLAGEAQRGAQGGDGSSGLRGPTRERGASEITQQSAPYPSWQYSECVRCAFALVRHASARAPLTVGGVIAVRDATARCVGIHREGCGGACTQPTQGGITARDGIGDCRLPQIVACDTALHYCGTEFQR
jgi:hypothetical protein